jgi:hypothetical protein
VPEPNGAYDPVARRLLLAYVLVWIFEGAARKWLLPALQQPLYFSRVVVVALAVIYVVSKLRRPWPLEAHLATVYVLFVAVFAATHMVSGAQTLVQAILGSRLWLEAILMPLALGPLLTRDDVLVAARLLVRLVFPIGLLALAQVVSPASAGVNKLLADDGSDNFTNAGGVVRASSVFSSSAGHVTFILVGGACAMVLLASARAGRNDERLGTAALPMLLLMALTSGSRSALLGLGAVALLSAPVLLGFSATAGGRTLICSSATVTLCSWLAPRLAPQAVGGIQARLAGDGLVTEPQGRVIDGLVGWLGFLPDAPPGGLGLGATAQGLGPLAAQRGTEAELGQWLVQLGPAAFAGALTLRTAAIGYLIVISITAVRAGHHESAGLLAAALVAFAGAVTSQGSVSGAAVVVVLLLLGSRSRPSSSRRTCTTMSGGRSSASPCGAAADTRAPIDMSVLAQHLSKPSRGEVDFKGQL